MKQDVFCCPMCGILWSFDEHGYETIHKPDADKIRVVERKTCYEHKIMYKGYN